MAISVPTVNTRRQGKVCAIPDATSKLAGSLRTSQINCPGFRRAFNSGIFAIGVCNPFTKDIPALRASLISSQ